MSTSPLQKIERYVDRIKALEETVKTLETSEHAHLRELYNAVMQIIAEQREVVVQLRKELTYDHVDIRKRYAEARRYLKSE